MNRADGIRPHHYGRRKGKAVRPVRQKLVDDVLPRLAIAVPEAGAPLDPFRLFAEPPRALWLEIGFGGGEHLAAQAAAHPDWGFIGCEVFVNGVASLVRHIAADGLANLRIFPEDARFLLPALPDACLAGIFLLFPDPWPKARHHKRRFVSPDNLDHLARLLIDGGEFRFASDHAGYVEWTLAIVSRDPRFTLAEGGARPADAPPTRYEAKAHAKGESCAYLRFRRRPRAESA